MLRQLILDLKQANNLTGVNSLLRRYFAMNGFDGALTTLGIVFGTFVAGVTDPKIVLFTAIAASIAMAVSGFWGTYLTEQSERKKEILQLERKMLTKMSNNKLTKAAKIATWEASFVNGTSSFVMALIIASPFIFARAGTIGIMTAYQISFVTAAIVLYALGAFLGKISKQNMSIMGFKMVIAGAASIAIALVLGAV